MTGILVIRDTSIMTKFTYMYNLIQPGMTKVAWVII